MNPAKTYSLLTEIIDHISVPNEAQILDISYMKEISKRQRDRVSGLSAKQPECVGHCRVSVALKCGVVSFYDLGNLIANTVGGLLQLF